jgi:hypothetical protein
MSLTKLSLAGNNEIMPSRESLGSDIPARDGKIANLFLQCGLGKSTGAGEQLGKSAWNEQNEQDDYTQSSWAWTSRKERTVNKVSDFPVPSRDVTNPTEFG